VTASVRRPKWGGAEPTRPPLNPPLVGTFVMLVMEEKFIKSVEIWQSY